MSTKETLGNVKIIVNVGDDSCRASAVSETMTFSIRIECICGLGCSPHHCPKFERQQQPIILLTRPRGVLTGVDFVPWRKP